MSEFPGRPRRRPVPAGTAAEGPPGTVGSRTARSRTAGPGTVGPRTAPPGLPSGGPV